MTRGLSLAFGVVLAGLVTACAAPAPAPAASSAADASSASVVALAAEPAAPSLYELSLPLVDQDGREIGLDVHRGRPVLLAMFYATCPTACPMLMGEIKKIEARLPADALARTRVLLVSLDPGTDTPEILAQALAREGVDPARWTLCRTGEESVRELSVVLGVRYKPAQGGGIDHTSALFLLDERGAIVEKLDGLGQPADALVARLSRP